MVDAQRGAWHLAGPPHGGRQMLNRENQDQSRPIWSGLPSLSGFFASPHQWELVTSPVGFGAFIPFSFDPPLAGAATAPLPILSRRSKFGLAWRAKAWSDGGPRNSGLGAKLRTGFEPR